MDEQGESMQPRNQRTAVRTAHLIGAASIGTYLYSPWSDIVWFALLNQAVIFPALAVSGLWMWLGPRFRKSRHD